MGVATLDASGKVPSAQLPANPGNFLPLAGGTMQGSVDMGGYDISTAGSVNTGSVFTNQINSLSPDIKVAKALDMENNKIVDVAKGSSTKDVATIENINDHDTSPFAHADIRNLIAAIQGTYVYVGKINMNTSDVDDTSLNNRVFDILARTPLNGDVLVDNDNGEWRFDGTNWVNLGHFDIALASALNDGLMTKEQYTKLNDLLNKADFDNLISTLATMTYLHNNYYNKADVDSKESVLNSDIVLRELLANKATDFSVVDDTKYPTTKAVSERLLNLPIAELNNHTLREVFENTWFYHDFENNINDWFSYNNSIFTQTILGVKIENPNDTFSGIGISQTFVDNNKYYYIIGDVIGNSTLQLGVYNLPIQSFTLSNTPKNYTALSTHLSNFGDFITLLNEEINREAFIKYIKIIELNSLGISSLTQSQMDYWFNVYQALLVSDTNAFSIIQNYASKTLEAWITPTLTGATSTYIRYRKDTLGTIIVEGNITVTTAGTNLTLPVGYRPLFAYTVGILTFNTDGTVVSSATGTQTLSVRYTGA